jgi:hypothetical protein
VWSIWLSRNNCIFANGVINPDEVVEEIKRLSWRWGMTRHKIPVCLFYEWCWDPGYCLGRWLWCCCFCEARFWTCCLVFLLLVFLCVMVLFLLFGVVVLFFWCCRVASLDPLFVSYLMFRCFLRFWCFGAL